MKIKNLVLSAAILLSGAGVGCNSSTLTPAQQQTQVLTDANLGSTVGVDVFLGTIKDPTQRYNAAVFMDGVVKNTLTAVNTGTITLDTASQFIANEISKGQDPQSQAAAQLVVKSVALLINQDLAINITFSTTDEKVAFDKQVLVSALNGVETGLQPYLVKPTPAVVKLLQK